VPTREDGLAGRGVAQQAKREVSALTERGLGDVEVDLDGLGAALDHLGSGDVHPGRGIDHLDAETGAVEGADPVVELQMDDVVVRLRRDVEGACRPGHGGTRTEGEQPSPRDPARQMATMAMTHRRRNPPPYGAEPVT